MKKILSGFIVVCMILAMQVYCVGAESNVSAAMLKENFAASNGISLPYRLYVPQEYSAEKEYSFLLFLHGAGNRGDDNESQVSIHTGLIERIINGEEITYNGKVIDSSKEFIILAPQCQKDNQWVDTPWSATPDPSYSVDDIAQSKYMTAVVELMDEIGKKYNLNASRMYVTGLSMGGFGTWDLLMRYPGVFAAAIPMGGAGDVSKVNIIKNTPVWTFHQMYDPVVASAGTVAMVKALVNAGAEVKFTPYFDNVHDAWTKGYTEKDLLQWLYSHTRDKKKVAFVGDSITYGAAIDDRASDSYPAVVQKKLGKSYEVVNFGVSATSALSSAVSPYAKTEEYKKSLEFNADILVIMLGTNDIKYENWTEGKDNFENDYLTLINSYKNANPYVNIFVGIPPRIFKENVFGERSPAILENEGIPAIYNVAKKAGAETIDFFTPTKDSPELFADYLHPNEAGYKALAEIATEKLLSDNTYETTVTYGASDWAKGEVALAYAAGIMPKNLSYGYQDDITREEFCEMVVNILPDNLAKIREAQFDDCKNEKVKYAYSVGIVNGVSDTSFAPDKNATREEMATMLYRAFRLIAPEAAPTGTVNSPDKAMISDWATEAVSFLNENKIMQGDDMGNISPKANTTSEQAVLLVYRTYDAAYHYGK